MDYLQSILDRQAKELKAILPLEGKLRAAAIQRNEYGGFRSILDIGEDRLSIVAQLSVKQPVSGYTDEKTEPLLLANMFQQGGASALSVVTEGRYHGGSFSLLSRVSRSSSIPLLARGWYTHSVQICQAIVCGADAVSLVMGAMDDEPFEVLYRLSTGLGLDVMVEVHTMREMERAVDLECPLICINNNDPHSFIPELETTERLVDETPADTIVLSSGGITTVEDARRMLEAGVNGVILDEILMRADIPQEVLAPYLDISLDPPPDV